MAYVTTSMLSDRLGTTLYARLTDRVNGSVADATTAQQIVDEAEALANSYLAKRYATPVDLTAHPEVASTLEARVLDLGEYTAWRTSPFVNSVSDRVGSIQVEALRWFEQVSAGRIHLPASSVPASRTAEDDSPRFTGEARTFTADELDGL
jgi:phage gp36-like protein